LLEFFLMIHALLGQFLLALSNEIDVFFGW
jgi:hypothetical protein